MTLRADGTGECNYAVGLAPMLKKICGIVVFNTSLAAAHSKKRHGNTESTTCILRIQGAAQNKKLFLFAGQRLHALPEEWFCRTL